MRESYNYWLNRSNYFGDGLAIGLVFGLFIGMIYFRNIAANAVLFTFLGGAIGSFIKKKRK